MLFNLFADIKQDPYSSISKPSTPSNVNQKVGQHIIEEEQFNSEVVKIENGRGTFPFAVSEQSSSHSSESKLPRNIDAAFLSCVKEEASDDSIQESDEDLVDPFMLGEYSHHDEGKHYKIVELFY